MYKDIVILILFIQNLEIFGNGTFDPNNFEKKITEWQKKSTKVLICVTHLYN